MSTIAERRQRRLAHNAKRYAGTYRAIPKMDWERLIEEDFGHPDWATLYPLNAKGAPVGILAPRTACKLFRDSIFMIQSADANPKYLQDKLPESAHKFYKKKQWRKQLFEAARRVACRLAKGRGFACNCTGEELFVHILLQNAFELGWNRSRAEWEALPETEKDRDFNRVARMGANEEIASLYRTDATGDSSRFKEWFKAHKKDDASMSDHFFHEVDISAGAGEEHDEDEDDHEA
jgi:hypothetical protein